MFNESLPNDVINFEQPTQGSINNTNRNSYQNMLLLWGTCYNRTSSLYCQRTCQVYLPQYKSLFRKMLCVCSHGLRGCCMDSGSLRVLQILDNSTRITKIINTCVPAPKCGRRSHFGAVGIAGLYIGRLRNCLPFLTSFTQCCMANLHIKCFDINAYQ